MVTLKVWPGSAVLLSFGWLLFPSLLGADDVQDAYKQGLKAIDDQQWDLAAEKMREALAGRSEESGKLLMKGRFRRYLPHYFLGVALFELGDCESALASWAESERQGVVTKRKGFYGNLVGSRKQCQARARLSDHIASLERQLAGLESEVDRASSLKRDPVLQTAWNKGSPSLAERQARAQDELRQAQAQLEQARSQADLDLLPEVENLLADARREWQAFEQQAEAQRAKTRSSRIAETQQAPKGNDEQRPDQPVQEAASPPAELDSAIRVFLDGDYPRVIEILEDYSAEDTRAAAHAHLLRSAALFALHRIRGDAELLILARGEARAAHAAEPELSLPERFFSPHYRELFQAAIRSDQEE